LNEIGLEVEFKTFTEKEKEKEVQKEENKLDLKRRKSILANRERLINMQLDWLDQNFDNKTVLEMRNEGDHEYNFGNIEHWEKILHHKEASLSFQEAVLIEKYGFFFQSPSGF